MSEAQDLFAAPEIERRKRQIDALFQHAIRRAQDSDPGYWFWSKSLAVIHAPGKSFEVYRALDQYVDELSDWLALNYPTKHWRPTGIFTRLDHILSVH